MKSSRFSFGRSFQVGSLVAAAALTLLVPSIAAQDGAEEAHPVHIHSGTCAELGDVVAPLADVALPGGEQMGPESAHPVKISEGNLIDMPLQEIIDGGHAINVHESAEQIDVYIACGDIGGIVHENEGLEGMELVIALAELNGSGHVGTAWLGADGEQTRVTVSLIEPAAMAGGGSGAAAEESSAAGAEASAESLAVEIKDFAYNPPAIDVVVGGSVTWTNQDNVPHTATAEDRDALQSGAIAFDESFTQTFDTAGSYNYFCEFHPNMKGTINVQ
jgi:plastocyanin